LRFFIAPVVCQGNLSVGERAVIPVSSRVAVSAFAVHRLRGMALVDD
jgi:hypothetical protein